MLWHASAELIWVLPVGFAVMDWYAVARGPADRGLGEARHPGRAARHRRRARGHRQTAGRWLLVALVFGLLGDIALLGDSLARFKAGLASFLIGHLAYLVCFAAALGLPRPGWSWAVFGLVLLSVVVTRDVAPATHRQGGVALSVPVAVYTAAIGAMLVCAWFTGEPLVALGATIFVANDAMLSVDRFVRPLPWAHLVVMVTYHVGQALMVAGVLAH